MSNSVVVFQNSINVDRDDDRLFGPQTYIMRGAAALTVGSAPRSVVPKLSRLH